MSDPRKKTAQQGPQYIQLGFDAFTITVTRYLHVALAEAQRQASPTEALYWSVLTDTLASLLWELWNATVQTPSQSDN